MAGIGALRKFHIMARTDQYFPLFYKNIAIDGKFSI